LDVVIGAPISRQASYLIDKFLSNQKEIQRAYPSSQLVLAASEHDFIADLEIRLDSSLRAKVIHYEVAKPDHARSHIWDIACGREALRRYTLAHTEARYLLFLDADMVFDPSVVATLEREIQGHDAVFSGYHLRNHGLGLAGNGCVMLNRSTLEDLEFRCCEFRNGEVIFEDNVLELDLFRLRRRVRKGFFVPITHHRNPGEASHITPQPLGLPRRIANLAPVRYALIRASIALHYNIPWKLKVLLSRSPASW
jgi:hypothetical protein